MRSGRIDSAPILTMGVVLALGGFAVLPAALLDVVTDGGHELSLAGAALLLIAFGAPLVWLFRLPSRMSTQGLFSSLVAGALAMMVAGAVVHLATGAVDTVVDDRPRGERPEGCCLEGAGP